MTWYLSDLARFRAERTDLELFGIATDWFSPIEWRFDGRMHLVLDADISAGGRTWPVFLQYPELFPHSPPSVFPRGDRSRWSNHQYGRGGELCLEYGPDNWTPDLTGVDLIRSAHRLLKGENAAPGDPGTVASRHKETIGQQFRLKYGRLLLTRSAESALASIPIRSTVTGTLVSASHKDALIQVLRTLVRADGTTWEDPEVPSQFADEYFEMPVSVYRIEGSAELPPSTSLSEFRDACAAIGFADARQLTLILRGSEVHHFYSLEKDNSVISIAVIPAQRELRRLDEAHERLRSKKVGLVGCGSVGSKVAAMLTRAGVGRWLLVDDDLLLSDNFVRHDLDWRDAGTHKAQAVARRIQLINPSVETTPWLAQLGGQSSSTSAETILLLLGECDLIVDATANPNVLNLVAAVSDSKATPVVWAEVFGGGIGGIVGRCRPGIEPPIQYMRRAIENWFGERDAPVVKSTRTYATGGDGVPMIADDADVSVIASNAARMAVDVLMRDASIFPYSAYAIGLSAGSVFTAPFDTHPIDVGSQHVEAPAQILSKDQIAREVDHLGRLLRKEENEASRSNESDQAT